MDRKQPAGTKLMPEMDRKLDANQSALVDELITPHSTKLNEILGCQHKITANYPAHNDQEQPVQARGRIVWNRAYAFQPHGPSYIDPIPDPGLGGGY